jgi:hypothetical protein
MQTSSSANASETPDFKIPNFLANYATCQKFCGLYEECLGTLSESFPECKVTKDALHDYHTTIKGQQDKECDLIKQWHRDMSLFYTRVDGHDDTLWEVMPLFSQINVADKVKDSGFPPESVQILWEYVEGMARHSRIYNAIPSDMLEKIQSTAMSYVEKVQSGEMKFDIENFNWDNIKNMGQSLMGSINPKDMEEFTGNMSGLASSLKVTNLQDVFKLIGDIPGVGNVMNEQSHLTGLLENLLQNPGTQDLLSNVDKLIGENANKTTTK